MFDTHGTKTSKTEWPRVMVVCCLVIVALAGGSPARAAAPVIRRSRGRPQSSQPEAAAEVNSSPHAVDDNLPVISNSGFQKLFVIDNDTDPDNDVLLLTHVGTPLHGNATCCQGSGDFQAIDYIPAPGFTGTDHFDYTITDGNGGHDVGVVTVTVAATGQVSGRWALYAAPDDRLLMYVNPNGGGPSGPNLGTCNHSPGLAIEDTQVQPGNSFYTHAFDEGVTLWVNNTQVLPVLPMAVTHHSLASGPVTMAGLNVSLAYYGVPSAYTLRTVLSLANPTGVSKTVTVTLASNLGSDNTSGVRGTSDGDLVFTTGDRWVVTSDAPQNPGLAVSTHVLFGPGSPLSTPLFISDTVFTCHGTQGIRARYHVTVPANSTRRLLFFNDFHVRNQDAVNDAAVYNSTPVALLQGLSTVQLSEIVNWTIGPITRLFLPNLQR
ncbi:MAG: Ig-like domain-containing protein [Anaerolineales bacterium]